MPLLKGFFLCFTIALIATFLGQYLPLVGAPILAIILGIFTALFIKNRHPLQPGITFSSKKILQYAVMLLGFGMNLSVIFETGKQSLPIIFLTIMASLLVSYILHKTLRIPSKIATLVGVGSSICGGSAIAATAPVVDANEDEIAQAISVIFFFNLVAAFLFPAIGEALGMNTTSGEAFGLFAGAAVNDTSSVTAVASTWDLRHGLGTATLDTAVTVKLTRTLAILPITLGLALWKMRTTQSDTSSFNLRKIFPTFILGFIGASILTTLLTHWGIQPNIFTPFRTLSRFFIVIAMSAIGLNTNLPKLVKTGGKPLILGFCCWISITVITLFMQHLLEIW